MLSGDGGGDPDDRRRNIVTLTATGRVRFKDLRRRLREAQRRALAPLSRHERDELMRMLQLLHDHLAPGPSHSP